MTTLQKSLVLTSFATVFFIPTQAIGQTHQVVQYQLSACERQNGQNGQRNGQNGKNGIPGTDCLNGGNGGNGAPGGHGGDGGNDDQAKA
ncbi:hypothetical protein PCO82_12270 [Pectobacteriaceae bacterium CE90]|nr:hypothetical protein PCO82_12270 [Pectobacteriaceae bacterium CE90]